MIYTELTKKAMLIAKENNLVIASHAEDNVYKYSPEGEYVAVRREIELAKEIGCKYHFCHMSTKESFEAIKKAQEAIDKGYISKDKKEIHLLRKDIFLKTETSYPIIKNKKSTELIDIIVD